MITEITIKLPLFKRWILKALIKGLLKNLEKSKDYYKINKEPSIDMSKADAMMYNQQRGLEQAINHVRVYCGMDKRDFRMEDYLVELNSEDDNTQ